MGQMNAWVTSRSSEFARFSWKTQVSFQYRAMTNATTVFMNAFVHPIFNVEYTFFKTTVYSCLTVVTECCNVWVRHRPVDFVLRYFISFESENVIVKHGVFIQYEYFHVPYHSMIPWCVETARALGIWVGWGAHGVGMWHWPPCRTGEVTISTKIQAQGSTLWCVKRLFPPFSKFLCSSTFITFFSCGFFF